MTFACKRLTTPSARMTVFDLRRAALLLIAVRAAQLEDVSTIAVAVSSEPQLLRWPRDAPSSERERIAAAFAEQWQLDRGDGCHDQACVVNLLIAQMRAHDQIMGQDQVETEFLVRRVSAVAHGISWSEFFFELDVARLERRPSPALGEHPDILRVARESSGRASIVHIADGEPRDASARFRAPSWWQAIFHQAGLATVDVPSTVWEGLMQGRIDGASPIVSSTWGQHQRVCAESAYEGRCSMFFLVASTPAARDRAAARIATLLSTVPPTTPASRVGLASSCILERPDNPHGPRCLASVCRAAKLAGVSPVVFLDAVAAATLGVELTRQCGARGVAVPDEGAGFPRITRRAAFRQPSRKYELRDPHALWTAKFYAWRLLEFDKVIWFDSDVWWQRSPLAVFGTVEPFASIKVTDTPAFCEHGLIYMNSGVMVLRPDDRAFERLRATWEHGNYSHCGGSEAGMGDQSVITHLAYQEAPSVLGPVSELGLCDNYRGWPLQAHCRAEDVPLLHGLALWPESWASEYETRAKEYSYDSKEIYEALDSNGYHVSNESANEALFLPLLLALSRGGERVVTLGCGTCAAMSHFSAGPKRLDVYGLDISAVAVRMATELGRAHRCLEPPCIVAASLTSIPWPDAHFDLVVTADALEHIHPSDVPQSLSELARVVKTAAVVNIAFGSSKGRVCVPREKCRIVELHLTSRPPAWWTAQFERQGLSSVDVPDSFWLSLVHGRFREAIAPRIWSTSTLCGQHPAADSKCSMFIPKSPKLRDEVSERVRALALRGHSTSSSR